MTRPAILLALFSLTSCATLVSGTSQTLTVTTPGVEEARCTLTDNKNRQWAVESTPGTVVVQKGDAPLSVTCFKPGYLKNTVVVGEGLSGATAGNGAMILFPPVMAAGVVVDSMSGAAQQYPERIDVTLQPALWDSPQEKVQWMEEHEVEMQDPGYISERLMKQYKRGHPNTKVQPDAAQDAGGGGH